MTKNMIDEILADSLTDSQAASLKAEDIISLTAFVIALVGLFEMTTGALTYVQKRIIRHKIHKEMKKELKLIIGDR